MHIYAQICTNMQNQIGAGIKSIFKICIMCILYAQICIICYYINLHKYARNDDMHKYANICSGPNDSKGMSPVHLYALYALYAKICKTCKHESHM